MLLLDENLSPKLCARISDVFPDCTHVAACGLSNSDDLTIWEFARDRHATIVTKGMDFVALAGRFGPPPKVIMLRVGNTTTARIETVIRTHIQALQSFITDAKQALLVV